MRLVGLIICAVLVGVATRAASPNKMTTSAICDTAAAQAATHHDVPVAVLRALTRTETGRKIGKKMRPWPWTVNMEGAGFWFDTGAEALEFARKHHGRGARSFDVGCFQINYRWHGEAFEDIPAMFDPKTNAMYAAKFIRQLYDESGNWNTAAGHYHSRTPGLAKKYRNRFTTIMANLGPAPGEVPLPRTLTSRSTSRIAAADRDPGLRSRQGPSAAGLDISQPQHSTMPGGVRLTAFSDGTGLLPRAQPLFN